jgi:hypothetical protein
MTNEELIKLSVEKYGESYRRLIEDSLQWLSNTEPKWDLGEPINKEEFLSDLVEHCVPIKE